MSAPPTDCIRLSDPAALIAAVPHLLGFHPHDSVVLMALHGKKLGLTIRADLVPIEHAGLLAEQLLLPMARQRPTGVVSVVIGGELTAAGDPPYATLVGTIGGVFGSAGLPVVHATWAAATAAGAPWRCYEDPLCAGTIVDPAATALAAATVAAGAVTFRDREQLAAVLAADEPGTLQRRAQLLDAADAEHPMSAELRARRLARLDELRRAAAAGHAELSDSTVAEVVSALGDHRVRDACLPWCTGTAADGAEQLWLALVRGTPAPHRAEPAALLALTAYLRGDGALAGLALDAAQQASPDHSLSGLLRAALEGGLPPEVLRTVAADATAALRRRSGGVRRSRPRRKR
ncbi:MAG: DUF4192 domain-containing protein [Pseudonocardiaceae bacterium]